MISNVLIEKIKQEMSFLIQVTGVTVDRFVCINERRSGTQQVSGINAHEQILKRHARVMCNKSWYRYGYTVRMVSNCKEF
jgi:hypothetical protein